MAMQLTIGTVLVDSVRVTLEDGRTVQVMSDGTVFVRTDARSFGNEYSFTLPTVEDVALECDANGQTGEVPMTVTAFHRH